MDTDTQRREFINQVWLRFEQVQDWAIQNWPDASRPLTTADFVAARQEILALGTAPRAAQRQDSEPAEGGAQYVDVTPAPWP